jgi:hypothetical protein
MTSNENKATLTRLIDIGVDQVFGDYDEHKSVRSRVIAILSDGGQKTIDLDFKGTLLDLGAACTEAIDKIEATGSQNGVSIIYMFDEPGELVFVQATTNSDMALCALLLKRQAGVSINDIHLVTEFGDSISFWEPSDWGGPTCQLGVQLTAEILNFPTNRTRKLNG